MSYTVLARRYRSRDFDQLVGQRAIAQTLTNAIETGRVAHAYLFVGTRGVGKTSAARIFAKAINGGSPEVDDAIMRGDDTDTVEIDAASNTSVDNARELIANANYRPLRGKKKIYIIDEVHMLSTAAFNALLKTLEEPPEHVMFILCTTETHKVPATIQSRCQRFDFRNLSASEIGDHLSEVLAGEEATAEPELIAEVARLGNGSMRDALSLLDRVIAAAPAGEPLTLALLEELLGLPDRALLSELIDAVATGEAGPALERFDELAARGTAVDQTIEQLVVRFRELMLLAACGPETDLVPLAGETREQAVHLASRFDAAGLCHMIALCESVQRLSKQSAVPRALADALVVRLAMTERIADVAALLHAGDMPPSSGTGGATPPKKA
ncbi:MAG: DNA polymerase III subunit gamma/tau [Planctomycetota bacterium]